MIYACTFVEHVKEPSFFQTSSFPRFQQAEASCEFVKAARLSKLSRWLVLTWNDCFVALTGWPLVFHYSSIRQKLVCDLVSSYISDHVSVDIVCPCFLLFLVRLGFSKISLQVLRRSSNMSCSWVSPSWIVYSENGSS